MESRAVSARRLLETYDKELRSPPTFDTGANQPSVDEVSIELELKGLQGNLDKSLQELAALNAKFQPSYPGVKVKDEEVAGLRRMMAEGSDRLRAARARADKDRSIRRITSSKDYLETVENNRKRVLADIADDEKEIDGLRQRLGEAQVRRDRMPVTADLVAPYVRAFAEAGRQLESREKAAESAREQVSVYERDEVIGGTLDFQVGNWAVAPVLPSGPGRMRWLLSAIGLGLAIGYGLTVVRRRFDEGMVDGTSDVLDLVPTGALVVAVPMLGLAPTERRNRRVDALCGTWVVVLPLRDGVRVRVAEGLARRPRVVPAVDGRRRMIDPRAPAAVPPRAPSAGGPPLVTPPPGVAGSAPSSPDGSAAASRASAAAAEHGLARFEPHDATHRYALLAVSADGGRIVATPDPDERTAEGYLRMTARILLEALQEAVALDRRRQRPGGRGPHRGRREPRGVPRARQGTSRSGPARGRRRAVPDPVADVLRARCGTPCRRKQPPASDADWYGA